jgi:hypothetical protein
MLRRVVWKKFTYVSEVLAASIIRAVSIIALIIVAASTSETSVDFYQITRRNIPEDSHIYNRSRKNVKSHQDGSGLGSCPMAGFGISGLEPSGSATTVLVFVLNNEITKYYMSVWSKIIT